MYGIIYKAAGPDGRVYIGQTVQTLTSRKSAHFYMAKKGDRRCAFKAALLDEGFNNFTWDEIDSAETREELDQKERYWIAHYKSNDPAYGYNGTDGGIHYTPNAEHRRKISEAKMGEKHPMYGKHLSEETKRKISKSIKGEKAPAAILTEDIVRQIKIELVNGKKCAALGKLYGVDRTTISAIKHGKTWGWLKISA